jgi:adenylate cyclase
MLYLRRLRAVLQEFSRPGEVQIPDRDLRLFTTVLLSVVIIVTNIVGAAIVVALLVLNLVPLPVLGHTGHIRLENSIVAAIYVAVAVPIGWVLGNRVVWKPGEWLLSGRAPSNRETRALLYAPRRLFFIQLELWIAAAVLFTLFNTQYSDELALRIAITVVLTGFVTASVAYLSTERVLRSLVARALHHGTPENLNVPGVTTRTILAWGLGTALPVGGLAAIGVVALANPHLSTHNKISTHALAISVVTLTGTAIIFGLLAVLLAVRTTSDPISSVRRGLAQVQRGNFDVRIPVYDASSIGQLQLGFNDMVAGLAERERIRAAFGTYVDPDVAARIIEGGTNLGGEQVDVTCMFIDVRGFTAFAERTPADQVVAALNAMFELTVPIIHDHGGRIDKFVGDGLLAVFGAPRRLDDHADRALAAAREIAAAVAAGGSTLSIGIGLNSGPVVAGNVGGGGRFEFSVIGDTVNVAARVEAATRQTDDVILLSEETVVRLDRPVDVVEREGITLKGKHDAVKVYALAE